MGARNDPGNDERRPVGGGESSNEEQAGEATGNGTPRPRQPGGIDALSYLRREHAERERQLRKALADAVRRQHEGDQRLLLAWLEELYTARSFLRAEDREVIRYRRLLREAS